jgi:threonyl-tRNA synthetase
MQRLPYLLVVGDKEKETQQVAVRTRGGQDLGQMPLAAFMERLAKEVAEKGGTA